MTVKELVRALANQPEDREVFVNWKGTNHGINDVQSVRSRHVDEGRVWVELVADFEEQP